jgi:ubiquitin-conjugating enzyme (huntingtin interacting protein 2)
VAGSLALELRGEQLGERAGSREGRKSDAVAGGLARSQGATCCGRECLAGGTMDLKRVRKEATELQADSDSAGVTATPIGDDMTHWKGTIHGPKDTPYDGGTFVIDIQLPSTYPFEPPKMKFDTRVWHPNVSSQTGAICLDILKKEWSPALTIKTALISVQALLAAPEPDDPQDGVVANEYKKDYEKWKRTAKLWTEQYALESSDTQALAPLLEMGFTEDQVRHVPRCRAPPESDGNEIGRASSIARISCDAALHHVLHPYSHIHPGPLPVSA